MQDLHNKIALVTGAASGIGRAIALRLAEEGMHLYLVDIDSSQLAEVVSEARRAGVIAVGRQCDVGNLEQINTVVEYGLTRWGKFDLLVNNAGITYFGQTDEMSAEHCEKLLAINLHAPMHITRLLLPTLLSQPEAHILNVASFYGLIGTRRLAAYTASKFGLVGFGESLRAEYARTGLGVTTLCPGFVDTKLFATAPRSESRPFSKQPPAWMLTSPEKIADRAIRGILRNDALVVTQSYAKLAYFAKRFFPGVIDFANHLSRKRFGKQTIPPPTEEERRNAA